MATDQRQRGLALGTPVRSRRAALKRAIAADAIDVALLLEGDVDEATEQIALGMRIADLVNAVPGVGHEAAGRVLEGGNPMSRLGELTTARRRQLAEQLRKETP